MKTRTTDKELVKMLEERIWSPITQHVLEKMATERGLVWRKPK